MRVKTAVGPRNPCKIHVGIFALHVYTRLGSTLAEQLMSTTKPALSSGLFTAFRLKPGDNLTEGLRAAFAASGLEAMSVVTCVGSLTRVLIRHANRPDGTLYSGHFEITSLVGTVDAAGEHLHLTISDGDGRVFGGHLLPEGSAVYTTAEIVALALPEMRFSREPCADSGYDELVITNRIGV